MKKLLTIFLFLLPSCAWAQSSSTQVYPVIITTSGCPTGQLSCAVPVSSANPIPVVGQ